jgi:hypothetical protein
MEYSKNQQLSHYYKNRPKKVSVQVPENALQQQINDLLDAYQIKYIRIPDGIWKWLQFNAPHGVLKYFQRIFGGIPDNVCIVPISDKYNLSLCAEIKTTTGKLHGKQKQWKNEVSVQILRSTTENLNSVMEYKKQIAKCKKCLQKKVK